MDARNIFSMSILRHVFPCCIFFLLMLYLFIAFKTEKQQNKMDLTANLRWTQPQLLPLLALEFHHQLLVICLLRLSFIPFYLDWSGFSGFIFNGKSRFLILSLQLELELWITFVFHHRKWTFLEFFSIRLSLKLLKSVEICCWLLLILLVNSLCNLKLTWC